MRLALGSHLALGAAASNFFAIIPREAGRKTGLIVFSEMTPRGEPSCVSSRVIPRNDTTLQSTVEGVLRSRALQPGRSRGSARRFNHFPRNFA